MSSISCQSCLRPIQNAQQGRPPVCADCWAQMSPAERCDRHDAQGMLIFTSGQTLLADALERSIDKQTQIMEQLQRTEKAMHIAAQAAGNVTESLAECVEAMEEACHSDPDWFADFLQKRHSN